VTQNAKILNSSSCHKHLAKLDEVLYLPILKKPWYRSSEIFAGTFLLAMTISGFPMMQFSLASILEYPKLILVYSRSHL
jgi:hypothetical protein